MLTLRRYQPGEVIIKENDIGETAYIIETGRVEVTKQHDNRKAHLGYLVSGELFGEMSMIDDKPRSATVTAVEATTVKEVHRDEFLEILKNDQETAVAILKVLFNRLRETDVQLLQLQAERAGLRQTPDIKAPEAEAAVELQVWLEGLTPEAAMALPENPYLISKFPFRIGRASADPFAHNDLAIPDEMPYQISRHHVTIFKEKNQIGVIDRGSTLGAAVDRRRFGGDSRDPGPVFFHRHGSTLLLGAEHSLYLFKVVIREVQQSDNSGVSF